MKYSKFIIKNYKGIKSLVLDLEKEPKSKVFTLVGLNESGKTSILEAINLFQNTYPLKDRHKLIPKSEKMNFNDSVSVSAELKLDENDNFTLAEAIKSYGFKDNKPIETIEITRLYKFTNSNFKEYTSTWTFSVLVRKNGASKFNDLPYEKDPGSAWQKFVALIQSKLMPRILYYPNFLFDFPDKIYLAEYDDNTLEQENYRAVIQDVLNSIDSNLSINEHLLSRLSDFSPSNKDSLEQTLGMMSTKISTVVFNAWAKLFNSKGKEIVIRTGDEMKGTSKRFFLEFKLKEGSTLYSIAERSLGFKWFFSFLLFTEFRKNRLNETGELLFLLDEPASNLHSTAQKNLLHTFRDIITKSRLIYTTHSHHLINPEWLNGAYIVRNKALNYTDELNYSADKTDIDACPYKEFVANHPDQRDYYQPILDTLDYQPGLLEKVPSIIITEGKFDYYTFKYLNLLYFGGKYKTLNFFPGGGADANFPTIRLYLAWSKPFFIILDGDRAGEKARKAYVKEFGVEVESKIFSFTDISKTLKGFSTEKLFSSEEQNGITFQFDQKTKFFDKSKFNTAIQNMLIQKIKFELDSNTIKRFKLIFDFLAAKVK